MHGIHRTKDIRVLHAEADTANTKNAPSGVLRETHRWRCAGGLDSFQGAGRAWARDIRIESFGLRSGVQIARGTPGLSKLAWVWLSSENGGLLSCGIETQDGRQTNQGHLPPRIWTPVPRIFGFS